MLEKNHIDGDSLVIENEVNSVLKDKNLKNLTWKEASQIVTYFNSLDTRTQLIQEGFYPNPEAPLSSDTFKGYYTRATRIYLSALRGIIKEGFDNPYM